MNCKQVLAIIDGINVAQDKRRQLESFKSHTRHCAKCRAALAAAETLETWLSQLSEPKPPEALSAVIRARMAGMQKTPETTSLSNPRVSPTPARSHGRLWLALTGAVAGLGTQVYRWVVGESGFQLTSSFFSRQTENLQDVLQASPAVLVLVGSLILCAAGLLAPSNNRGETL